MGPTIVPFRERSEAEVFAATEGGRVLPAAELTPEVLEAYRIEVREAMRAGGMQGMKGMKGGRQQGGPRKGGSMPSAESQPGKEQDDGKSMRK